MHKNITNYIFINVLSSADVTGSAKLQSPVHMAIAGVISPRYSMNLAALLEVVSALSSRVIKFSGALR